jgi:hypothetical protein
MNNKLTQNYEVLKNTIKDNNLKKLLYWKNINFENKYKITKEKYLIFKPWNGGFNNVKMSLEIASVIAYRLNRILVMPSHTSFSIDHLKKQYELSEFFDVKNIGIETMNMKKFCSQNNITEDWDEIKNISKVYNFDITNSYLNLTKEKEIDYKFHKERDIINIDNSPKNIYFDGNLLGSFYTILHDKNMNELKKYVGKCIHYNKIFFSMAESVIYYLESNYGKYYSMHIRRGDFNQVYNDVCVDIDTIHKNIRELIPEGSYLYISTDIVNKKDLGILNDKYKIFIFKDVINLIKCDNEDFYGLIEQIICSRGEKFIGTKLSTFSNYIYRLRGYMNDITDKNYYINTELNTPDNKIEQEWYIEMNCLDQIWSREFKDGFNFTKSKERNQVYTIKGKVDGFGSQYQAMMSGIAICDYKNYIYFHTPFNEMEHDVNIDILNKFIGINNNRSEIKDLSSIEINNMIIEMQSEDVHWSETPSMYYTPEVVTKIRDWYYSTEKPNVGNIDIAIHIRRGDVSLNNPQYRYTDNNIYIKLINLLQIKYPFYNILIFSEGHIDDFKELNLPKKHFKLNEDITKTFHSLVSAKILITAKSSFSICAAILNKNIVYYQDYWHKPLDYWLNINSLI